MKTTVLETVVWRNLSPALAFKVTVVEQLWIQSDNTWINEDKSSSHLGRTSHLATGEDTAKSLSLTQCFHLWASWGIALSLGPQHSPRWSRMFYHHTWPVAPCSWQRWRCLRWILAWTKMFCSLPEYCQSHTSTCPETQPQNELNVAKSCLQPVGVNFDHRLDSLVTIPVHQENKNHGIICVSPPVWLSVYDLSVHL